MLDPNHKFDNFARASLTVIAVFFQKSWSTVMAETADVSGLLGYVFFILLVIGGSFCIKLARKMAEMDFSDG